MAIDLIYAIKIVIRYKRVDITWRNKDLNDFECPKFSKKGKISKFEILYITKYIYVFQNFDKLIKVHVPMFQLIRYY